MEQITRSATMDLIPFLDYISDQGQTIGYQEALLKRSDAVLTRLERKLQAAQVEADFSRGYVGLLELEIARLRKIEAKTKAKPKAVRKK